MTDQILGFFDEYRFLSNFEGPGFTIDGVFYKTNEHFYQAWKAENVTDFMFVRQAKTPGEAKKRGRTVKIRPEWDEIKLAVMETGLRGKFNTEGDDDQRIAAEKLLATGDAYLEETNGWGDTFWGVCGDTGSNHLGIQLMALREELRHELDS